jgi:hypothetical protein
MRAKSGARGWRCDLHEEADDRNALADEVVAARGVRQKQFRLKEGASSLNAHDAGDDVVAKTDDPNF